ncbi:MAG TPA: beta-eliminating lyase-related protein [Steroidobacteraceae bacterium]|nr:beta-eliminating lyase-related protein [Steroidobacteraceae bacterium]
MKQSKRFCSDNTASVSPEILQAIAAANSGLEIPYGDDPLTQRLDEVLGEFFGTELRAFVVTTGTAANSLALATLSPPYGAIYCHPEAHIAVDECGAPGFFSGGAQLERIEGERAKFTAEALAARLDAYTVSVHGVQPAAVSISQATELGAAYRPSEVAALCEVAHARGLHVHMDGARFANAVAYLGCHPGDVTWRAGVDVLSFGATKNGALAAEAVVFFHLGLVRDFELRRKRAGHLLSKSRFVSAQLLGYIESGVWRRNAERANRLARSIGAAAGGRLLHPVEANEVFVELGVDGKASLQAAGFEFYDWGSPVSGAARLVTSWDQDERHVEALCAALTAMPVRRP